MPDTAHLGRARREASAAAASLGSLRDEVALIAGEIASNLVRHAGGGLLLVTALAEGQRHGVEMLACDAGPGMADVRRCLQDGWSSAGTLGSGLTVITRLSHEFDLYSRPGWGTVLVSRVWSEKPDRSAPPTAALRVGPEGLLAAEVLEEWPDGRVVGTRQNGRSSEAPRGSTVVMHSGQVDLGRALQGHPGVLSHHPAIVAGVLFRASEGREGTLVVVGPRRYEEGRGEAS